MCLWSLPLFCLSESLHTLHGEGQRRDMDAVLNQVRASQPGQYPTTHLSTPARATYWQRASCPALQLSSRLKVNSDTKETCPYNLLHPGNAVQHTAKICQYIFTDIHNQKPISPEANLFFAASDINFSKCLFPTREEPVHYIIININTFGKAPSDCMVWHHTVAEKYSKDQVIIILM